MLYNVPYFGDSVVSFLMEVARAKGRLRKGGVPDLDGTARSIIRDWVAGRIAYYTSPPSAEALKTAQTTAQDAATPLTAVTSADVGSATLLNEFAPAFDLAALFGEADAVAFGESGVAGSAIEGKTGVRISEGFEMETEDANVGWVAGAEDSSEEEEEDDMDADDSAMGAVDVDDLLEDADDDDDDEMDDADDSRAEVAPAPVASVKAGKKRAAPQIVSVAPPASKKARPTKSVSFSSQPLGPTGSSMTGAGATAANATTQHTQQIADEVESIALGKQSAKQKLKQAKKDKKRAAVKALSAMPVDDGSVDRDEIIDKPRKARTVAGGAGVDEAYSFEEFFPTAGKGAVATRGGVAEDSDEEEL